MFCNSQKVNILKTPFNYYNLNYYDYYDKNYTGFTIFPTKCWHQQKITWNLFVQSELRIHWKFLTILKTSNKSVWINISWYVKVCIFWKSIKHTIHWDKKFPSDKINGTKNDLFFLSRFLFELKHKVRLSETVCGIFRFWFRFVFIKVYIFYWTKCMGFLTLKRHNSFQN